MQLFWEHSKQGFNFYCASEEGEIAPDRWGAYELNLPSGGKAHLAPIFQLIDQDCASIEGTRVWLKDEHVADLLPFQLAGLGLPLPMPFNISIAGNGLISNKGFKFSYVLKHRDTRPVMKYDRIGALLKVGNNTFIISQPYFRLIEKMDAFNNRVSDDASDCFMVLSELKEFVPQDFIQDDYLRKIEIFRADSFSLTPKMGVDGQLTFDPVLYHEIAQLDQDMLVDSSQRLSAMPQVSQQGFANQFCRQKVVRESYAVSNGRYCVLAPELKKTLEVVRSVADKPEPIRRAFLANPRVFLREKLETQIPEAILENIFKETEEYSERVLEIGVWVPPVLPILKRASEPWLPPEILGIRVGNREIDIKPEELPELIKSVEKAIDDGEPSVKLGDQTIPATQETLSALFSLNEEMHKSSVKAENNGESCEPKKTTTNPIGLLIDRHLEEVGSPLKRRITVGGSVERSITGMVSSLLPHQQSGVEWLQEHWLSGSRGALLADDMGLGKTFQVLAFLFWVRQLMDCSRYEKLPIFLVAPTGLLKNWQDEINQHLGQFGLGNILLAYGANLKTVRHSGMTGKSEGETGIPSLNIELLRSYDTVLTTYETLRDYQLSFGAIHWGVAVFDEAQKIKNPAVRITDAAKAMHADFSITMTGTPVENRLADLWSICDLCQPGSLFSLKQFSEKYEQASCEENLHALKAFLTEKSSPALMLRRLKEDNLKGLPQREYVVLKREMPSEQASSYQEIIKNAHQSESVPGQMLQALHGLRSVSLHPLKLAGQSDEEYIKQSARLMILFELLENIESKGEKALIFVESLEMHGILAELLQRRFKMATPPLIISGEVGGDNRKKRVDIFQMRRGFDAMILSPRAGGVGLTLHAANHVIHLSRWWNPAVEDQCTDRVYRIGQKKKVFVYLPLAVHPSYPAESFDLRLHDLLERKRSLSRTLLAPVAVSQQEVASLYRDVIA